MGRLLGSAAMAAVLAAGLAGGPTGASGLTGRGTPARTVAAGQVSAAGSVGVAGGAAAAGPVRPVLLIDGARLLAGRTAGGGYSHNPMAGTAAGLGAALVTLTLGAKTYVVPLDAFPYLGRGLSPSLFDIGSLLGERGGRLAVRISYAGHLPPLPGVTITSASGGSASGYLTEASAQRFGAALARQYAADHDRASYGQDGLFADQVSISLPGAAAARRPTAQQTAARPDGARPGAAGPGAAGPGVRHFPMQTLTMTATNLAGRPDTGDSVEVLNADDVTKFDDPLESNNVFYRGVAKFSVPPGHYWALGSFSPPAKPGQPFSVRMVVLPQFTVRGSTTVHMNERAASSPVQEVTPRPAQSSYTFFVLIRLGAARVPGIMGLLAFIPGAHMWVSPTSQRPTVGGLQSFTATELDSPPGTPGTPYAYGLAYLDTSGLVPAQRHIVNPATLAHVHARYYQAVPARVQHFMTVGTTLTNKFVGQAGSGVIFRAPGKINEYLSASHALIWSDGYFQQAALFTSGGGQMDFGRTFAPGQRVTENWGEFPLHVAPNDNLLGAQNYDPFMDVSAARTGDTLGFSLNPFSGNQPGYTGSGFLGVPGVKFSGQYVLDENGKRIASGNAARPVKVNGEFGTTVAVSPRPAVFRLLLTALRSSPGFPLSPASSTTWTWRSSHEAGGQVPPGWLCPTAFGSRDCAVQPLMTLQYAVQGMGLTGSVPAGQQVLRVFAAHLPLAAPARVTALSVSVSFDGGKTWHPARVSGGNGRYTAVYSAPAGALVTLRTSATDAAGGAITDLLTDAYRTTS